MRLKNSICLTIAASLALTACITDPQLPRLDKYRITAGASIAPKSPAIMVSAAAFKGHRRHHDLSVLLEREVARSVQDAGFRLAVGAGETDYELSAELLKR